MFVGVHKLKNSGLETGIGIKRNVKATIIVGTKIAEI